MLMRTLGDDGSVQTIECDLGYYLNLVLMYRYTATEFKRFRIDLSRSTMTSTPTRLSPSLRSVTSHRRTFAPRTESSASPSPGSSNAARRTTPPRVLRTRTLTPECSGSDLMNIPLDMDDYPGSEGLSHIGCYRASTSSTESPVQEAIVSVSDKRMPTSVGQTILFYPR